MLEGVYGAVLCEQRLAADHTVATRAALGAESGTTLGLAWLFVEFANSDLFLNSATFDKFAEPADGLLSSFSFAKR